MYNIIRFDNNLKTGVCDEEVVSRRIAHCENIRFPLERSNSSSLDYFSLYFAQTAKSLRTKPRNPAGLFLLPKYLPCHPTSPQLRTSMS